MLPFCSIFNVSRPSLWISISQTPLQFSRCYDKPWLVNSKAGTPVRDSHYPDLQLPSPEVEYGLLTKDTVKMEPWLRLRARPAALLVEPVLSPFSPCFSHS